MKGPMPILIHVVSGIIWNTLSSTDDFPEIFSIDFVTPYGKQLDLGRRWFMVL